MITQSPPPDRINYIYLFDFNPRIVDTPMLIFNDVVDETLVFLLLMLLYYKSGAHEMPDLIPPGCYPLILVVYTVKCLIFPLRTRGPLWVAIWEVITAPLTSPKFFHTYVADVFTSSECYCTILGPRRHQMSMYNQLLADSD